MQMAHFNTRNLKYLPAREEDEKPKSGPV